MREAVRRLRTAGSVVAAAVVALALPSAWAQAGSVARAQGAGLAQAASAAPGWSPPFRFAGPMSLDVLPAQVAFSARGQAAVAFAVQNEDDPSTSQAYVLLRDPGGTIASARAIPGAQEVLDLGFARPGLELLTGASSIGYSCCSSVRLMRSTGAGFAPARTLVRGLAGATLGRLIAPAAGGLLAAVASSKGVWGGSSRSARRPPAPHRLASASALPQTLDATALAGGHSVVAWSPTAPAGSIFVAVGPKLRRAVRAFSLPAGHDVDQLGIAPASGDATVAWIESWVDRHGKFHSQAAVADLAGGIRRFPVAGEQASDLSFAGDSQGDQLLVWKTCNHAGTCTVRAANRPAGASFGRTVALGRTDPSQAPAAAVASDGEMLVGWIDLGHVLAADRPPGAPSFSGQRVVSATNFAADLTIAFGPGHIALAAWTQGTFAQSVMGAVHG